MAETDRVGRRGGGRRRRGRPGRTRQDPAGAPGRPDGSQGAEDPGLRRGKLAPDAEGRATWARMRPPARWPPRKAIATDILQTERETQLGAFHWPAAVVCGPANARYGRRGLPSARRRRQSPFRREIDFLIADYSVSLMALITLGIPPPPQARSPSAPDDRRGHECLRRPSRACAAPGDTRPICGSLLDLPRYAISGGRARGASATRPLPGARENGAWISSVVRSS